MAQQWIVITGAGTGIGAALAVSLSRALQSSRFLLIGRRTALLEETRTKCSDPALVDILSVDLAHPNSATEISSIIPKTDRVAFLIHNAAVLNPASSATVSQSDWTQAFQINVHAPLHLTQSLLDRMSQARVIHISSGAAHRAIPGWAAYCASKSAFHMLFRSLQLEVPKEKALFGSVRPGIVDTPMQEQIRGLSPESFPMVDFFRSKKANSELEPVEKVARFLEFVLLETSKEEFEKDEWDIRDEHHQHRWNGKASEAS